jgi:hypothetical protein
MPCTNQQIMEQLDRMSLIFEPPMPKAVHGLPNPKYTALVAVYLDALRPFRPWELEAGVKVAMESHKYNRWPKPAELRAWCLQAQRDSGPPVRRLALPPKPERHPQSQEQREKIGFQFGVLTDFLAHHQQGETFPLTLAQCKTEAARRQQAWQAKQNSRQSQAS